MICNKMKICTVVVTFSRYLKIIGRSKEVINVGGQKVLPSEG